MKKGKKYLSVWDSIHSWVEFRLSQKEELSTSEVKHLAEIQEKIQKNIVDGDEHGEKKSSLELLAEAICKSRKKHR